MTPLLELKDVYKTFQMGEVEFPVLKGIHLSVYAGEMVVILGPSGSGKTTLLNIMGAMDTPTKGVVLFQNREIGQASEEERTLFRRNHVGFVFQHYNLVSTLTALENIELASEIAQNPIPPRQVLHWIGMEDHADFFPSQLSGGQQQRIAIGRAVTKRPSLLLCDEPTGALDEAMGREVLKLLERINEEEKIPVVIITHNQALASMASKIVALKDGVIDSIQEQKDRRRAEEIRW
ncbi:MAG: ABC transporter ATP-binding protein [Planctomycetota bacterium]|nr:MAG: ABC transporter ATP-binding protein [Planctomycetota bacterium]